MNHGMQIDVLYRDAVRLCSRSSNEYFITLYQIEYFYVEVFYHKKRKHVCILRAFSAMELLDPYLDSIDLSKLA